MAHFVKFEIINNDSSSGPIMVNVDNVIWAFPFKEDGYSKLQMVGGGVLKVRGDLSELGGFNNSKVLNG
jgi:hypothetical protein